MQRMNENEEMPATSHENNDCVNRTDVKNEFASRNLIHNLPVVSCECGAKILLVPDLDEMVRSVEAHASKHGRNEADPKNAEIEYCRIEGLLTEKILILASKKGK
jgi:hypothetical protein